MKINQVKNQTTSKEPKEDPGLSFQDLTMMYAEFQEQHRNVFMQQFDNQVFFFRSLGRAEYREIVEDTRFKDLEKEELICEMCTLFPEEFDFEDCDAGVPTELAKAILRNSFLDSSTARRNVLTHYRNEMTDLDNQITCIITEAFPHLDIEDIEQWDVEKTTKYLSRAEWKLHNLRGIPFNEAQSDGTFYEREEQVQPQETRTEELIEDKPKVNHKGNPKEKMTPEKLRELREKFPEIDWSADVIANEGIEGMKDSIDVTSPALRPGF